MRIGVDGRVLTDHYPGIGRALFSVLPHLATHQDTIVLIRGPETESDRFPISQLMSSGVEIHDTPVGLRTIGEQIHPPATAVRRGLDVVLTPYFASALRWPCPRVTMVHDLIPLAPSGGMSSRLQRLGYALFLRATLGRSRRIVAPSQATADSLCRFAPGIRSRVRLIPIAVAPRFSGETPTELPDLRRRHQLEGRHVLTVAGDRPHKNLALLTDAWTSLDPTVRGNAVLVLVGFPAPRIDHPAVRVLGAVTDTDLQTLYESATMVAVPSLEEGFGLPVAEALVRGAPVVCSHLPVLRELAGDAAVFFDPNDPVSIAGSLARLLNDRGLRLDLRRRGPRRVARLAPSLIAADLLETCRAAATANA